MNSAKNTFFALLFFLACLSPSLALADNPGTAGPGAYYGTGLTGSEAPATQGWGGGATFASLVGQVIGYLNSIVWVLGSVAVVFFLLGVLQYIYHQGSKPRRTTMLWSLLALFILFSLWGILRLMCSSLLSTSCGTSSSQPLNILQYSNNTTGSGAQTSQ